jgi:hypothetical protein
VTLIPKAVSAWVSFECFLLSFGLFFSSLALRADRWRIHSLDCTSVIKFKLRSMPFRQTFFSLAADRHSRCNWSISYCLEDGSVGLGRNTTWSGKKSCVEP